MMSGYWSREFEHVWTSCHSWHSWGGNLACQRNSKNNMSSCLRKNRISSKAQCTDFRGQKANLSTTPGIRSSYLISRYFQSKIFCMELDSLWQSQNISDMGNVCATSWYRRTGFMTSSKSLSLSIIGRSERLLIWWEDNDLQLQHQHISTSHCPGERWIIWISFDSTKMLNFWAFRTVQQHVWIWLNLGFSSRAEDGNFTDQRLLQRLLRYIDRITSHRTTALTSFKADNFGLIVSYSDLYINVVQLHITLQELVQAHQRSCCAQSWPGQNAPRLLSFAWTAFTLYNESATICHAWPLTDRHLRCRLNHSCSPNCQQSWDEESGDLALEKRILKES